MTRDETQKAMHDAIALLQRERDMVYECEDDGSGNIPPEARTVLDEFDAVIIKLRAAHLDFMTEFVGPPCHCKPGKCVAAAELGVKPCESREGEISNG